MPHTKDATSKRQQRGIDTQAALLDAAGRVFSRMTYDQAKLKDIADESNISLGSLYFHFGNKEDVAAAVLAAQQTRMTEVLSLNLKRNAPALVRLLDLLDGMAKLIAEDSIVQAGIQLVGTLPPELRAGGVDHYAEWQRVTTSLIAEGVSDGSVTSELPVIELGELLNEVFVGAQIMSGMSDHWSSLPDRIHRARPIFELLFGAPVSLFSAP